jgi:hypothetical protein
MERRRMDSEKKVPSWWSGVAQDIGLQLTLIGLFCYGVARFAVDAFLYRFDLTLGDVGLGYSELLAPVAFLAVAVFMVGTVLLLAWWAIIPRLTPEVEEIDMIKRERSTRAALILALSLVIDALFVAMWIGFFYLFGRVLLLLHASGASSDILRYIFGIATGATVLTYVVIDLAHGLRILATTTRDKSEESSQSRQPLFRAAGAAVTLSLILVAAHQYGLNEAERAASGERITVHVLGITMPGLEAHPGTVRVNFPGDILALGGNSEACLIRLVESGGFVIFHDKRRNTTVRLPSLDVSVTDLGEGQRC